MKNYKPNHFSSMIATEEKTLSNGKKYTIRETRVRYFFPDEWMAFYDLLKDRQKITFNFLINTGARISEVSHIKVGDFDFDRQSVIIQHTKSRNKDGSRKMRVISVSTQFIKWVKKIVKENKLKHDDYFPILSIPAANIAMKKALKGIGLKDWQMFSVHNVRKTLETWLMALDVDSVKISKHFGHSLMVASKFYVSADVFGYEDKKQIRDIIGDLHTRRVY